MRSSRASFCFLVGAGCSTQYPLALHVTRPIISLLLGRPPKGREPFVRFEFLMQVIKDFFDPQLTFLSDIYGVAWADEQDRPVVRPYERLFALLALDDRNQVFTTNFDRSIERAAEIALGARMAGRSAKTFQSVFRKREFGKALKGRRSRGLFKLHGSIDEPGTLAATYDAIVPAKGAKGDPRQLLLARALRRSALCVVGYSGFDDMDVVPTLLGTKALNREVHWFHHGAAREDQSIAYRAFAAQTDDIDRSIRKDQKPVLPILDKLVTSRHRSPRRVTVHYGRTEATLSRFLMRHVPQGEIREAAVSLTEGTTTPPSARRRQATRAIHDWWACQAEHAGLLLRSAAIDVFYQHGAGDRLLGRLAADLDRATELRRKSDATAWSARLIALPRSAKVSYSCGDYERVADYIQEGRDMLADAMGRRAASKPTSIAPALVVGAIIELEQWGVEALRMQEELTDFVEVERRLACDPRSVWERLQSCAVFSAQTGSQQAITGQFDALRASAMTTQADIAFSRGRFHRAKMAFERAERAWSRAGNGYWASYCAIGSADSDLHLGELAKARAHYEHVRLGNVISGWAQWIDFWPLLHLKDIQRLTRPSRWMSVQDDSELAMLLAQREDSDVSAIAAVIAWTKSWTIESEAFESVVDRYRQITRRRWWRPTDRVGLQLLFVEFLMHAGKLESAERAAEDVRRKAEEERAELFALRARILSLEIRRRQGHAVHWRSVFALCRRKHYSLGKAYVLAIAMVDGQKPPGHETRWARRWSTENGLHWLRRRLNSVGSGDRRVLVPLRFPYCYM